MAFDRLAQAGLAIVGFGWILLFSGGVLMDLIAPLHTMPPSPNLGGVAQATILSGFGLAILGVLRTGLGSLDRFFSTILDRTAKAGEQPRRALPELRPAPALPAKPPKPKKVVERGRLKDRAYTLFVDGSVEIETLLGLRRFTSLEDAQDFIS